MYNLTPLEGSGWHRKVCQDSDMELLANTHLVDLLIAFVPSLNMQIQFQTSSKHVQWIFHAQKNHEDEP